MDNNPHVAVVGATGAVGIEMIKTLEKRNFPVGQLTLLASSRSAGRNLRFRTEDVTVQELNAKSFRGVKIALFSAGSSISKEFAPLAAKAGCVVIDNSSAFRMDSRSLRTTPTVRDCCSVSMLRSRVPAVIGRTVRGARSILIGFFRITRIYSI